MKHVYKYGQLVDDELPKADDEVAFTNLASAMDFGLRVADSYAKSFTAEDRQALQISEGFGRNLHWGGSTRPAADRNAVAFHELWDDVGNTGYYVRVVLVFESYLEARDNISWMNPPSTGFSQRS